MPIAAVPRYLGHDFSGTSPGLRFGYYLPIWTNRKDQEREINDRAEGKSREADELRAFRDRQGMDATIAAWTRRDRNPVPILWEKSKTGANAAWKAVARLTENDQKTQRALSDRQSAFAQPLAATGQLLTLEACATAPFATGLGNEHPLENGFAFLNPYGLPYLPGSGVKGVLRQAARELARGDWGETGGWDNAATTALFGREASDGDSDHQRGALSFWDVIPRIAGDSLMVEIMTPHQTHYYQKGDSPHESGQPTPINFLTVPPGSRFVFHVRCDLTLLHRLEPSLAASSRWGELLAVAFGHAFRWLGFGAKTAVGYGAMERISEAAAIAIRAADERAQARCDWVDATVRELAAKNNARAEDTLRGKSLAEAWAALTDPRLKARALADIRARWQEKGWWDTPPGGASKKARTIYETGSDEGG